MFLSDLAIKRPTVTVVTMLALVVFGVFALWSLEIDEFPDVQPPIVAVSVPYPGASPEGVEREVIDPDRGGLRRHQRRRRRCIDRTGWLRPDHRHLLAYDKDLRRPRRTFATPSRGSATICRPEMEEPILTRFDPGEMPIVSLALSSQSLAAPELTQSPTPAW